MHWLPLWSDIERLIFLSDYNTRIVLLGSAILGMVAGTMGTFMMLRRRAMISDVVSHAALPGIVAAFMISASWPGGGKHLPTLLLGALISGLLGMAAVHIIKIHSHIKEDAALGIVLSVFFGMGVVLLGFVQRMKTGSAAGLESFIYGKTASMIASDAWLMAGSAALVGGLCLIFFKEFRLLCFDAEFARAQGWPVHRLDAILTSLVVMVTVIGLQAVGLILMIAMLVIPPAAARCWTDRLGAMIFIAALLGAISAVAGSAFSALYPNLPAGAMIVMVCAFFFVISLVVGSKRGILKRILHQKRLSRRVARHHLLRGLYEKMEQHHPDLSNPDVAALPLINVHEVGTERKWSVPRLRTLLHEASSDHEVELGAWPLVRLTAHGLRHARQIVRNHRLWEWYLIQNADVDANHVDRDADEIEHVLGEELVAELERTYLTKGLGRSVPASPHPISASAMNEGAP